MADHGSFRSGYANCCLDPGPHKSGVEFTEPQYRRVENVGKTPAFIVDGNGKEFQLLGGHAYEGYLLSVMAVVTKETQVNVTDEIPVEERTHVIN